MRWAGIFLLGLVASFPIYAEDWTTEDGKTYKNVTVLNQEDDGVRITYAGGVGKIPYYELSVDIQKRFGQDIESSMAKKKAVDQAIEEAVRSAIAAEQIKQPVDTKVAPHPTPGANPSTAMGTSPGGVSPGNGGSVASGTSNGSGASTTSGGSSSNPGQPGDATGSTPGTPAAANTVASANGGKPGVPGGPGKPAQPGGQGMPSLNDYDPSHPNSGGHNNAVSRASKLTYNDALNICYLDSPSIELIIDSGSLVPKMPGQSATMTWRVVSEGAKPTTPDQIESTFLAMGTAKSGTETSDISFVVDGTTLAIDKSQHKDSGVIPGSTQSIGYITFYLTTAEAKTISEGKDVELKIAPTNYRINLDNLDTLNKYMKEVQALPATPSSMMRSYYKMLSKLPSFMGAISTVCEYAILGSFGILVCASVAAFVMGVTRFIKM